MMSRPLAGFVAVLGLAAAQTPGIEGTWQGELTLGTVRLRLGLQVQKSPTGEYLSKMVSIDQGAAALQVRQTTFSGNKLHLDLPTLHATFDGTLNSSGSEIAGTYTQTLPLPLTFKRVDKLDLPNRPQEPEPPFRTNPRRPVSRTSLAR